MVQLEMMDVFVFLCCWLAKAVRGAYLKPLTCNFFLLQVGSNEFVFQCLSVLTDCAKFETLFRRKETDTLSVSHGDRQQKGCRDKG